MSTDRDIKVAVFMGGPSHEHAISLASGRDVAALLSEENCSVTPVVIHSDGRFQIRDEPRQTPLSGISQLLGEGVEVAFCALHGEAGEDGAIQGLLEWAGLPYTFSGVEASVIAMNKCAYKALLVKCGLPTAPFEIVMAAAFSTDPAGTLNRGAQSIGFPSFIKSPGMGSSFGVHRVTSIDEARAALLSVFADSRQALWEKGVEGVELTAAILGDAARPKELEALPLVEIEVQEGRIFDTQNKYDGTATEIVPARVSEAATAELQHLAREIHILLGCETLSRTDAILTDSGLVILETNTIPGLTSQSLFPKAAGNRFASVLRSMVEQALVRRTIFTANSGYSS